MCTQSMAPIPWSALREWGWCSRPGLAYASLEEVQSVRANPLCNTPRSPSLTRSAASARVGWRAGGIPLRLGLRDGNRSDSVETPVAIEECLALGLEGVRGIVADSKAYSRRTLGVCLEQGIGLVTLVPRTCAVRH